MSVGFLAPTLDRLHNFKRELCLYDKLLVDMNEVEETLSIFYDIDEESKYLATSIQADLEYLTDEKVVEHVSVEESLPTYDSFFAINTVEVSDFVFNESVLMQIPEIILGKDFLDKKEYTQEEFVEYFRIKQNLLEFRTRNFCPILELTNNYGKVTPIVDSFVINHFHKMFGHDTPINLTKHNIFNILIRNVPMIDQTEDIERITEFKKDPKSHSQILALRKWINEMSVNNDLDIEVIENEIKYLLDQYKNHMKVNNIKYKLGMYDIILKPPLDIVENLVKFNLSAIPKSVMSFKEKQLSLFEAELNCSGRELAYISRLNETFNHQKP